MHYLAESRLKDYSIYSEDSHRRTRSLNTEKDLTYVPWSAFESLACWYNCKIAGGETEDYGLSAMGITDPAELYRQGVVEYINRKIMFNFVPWINVL